MVRIIERTMSGWGKGIWIVVLISLFVVCGCGTKLPFMKDSDEDTQRVIVKNPPRSIAILPFGNQTDSEDISQIVRTTLYSHMSAHPYTDIELHEIDRKLRRYDLMEYEKFCDVSAKRLGRILNCDAVVVGKVTEFQKVYAGIYSQIAVGASITVWDTRTGKQIWTYQADISTAPKISNHLVFVGLFNGKLIALDIDSGKVKVISKEQLKNLKNVYLSIDYDVLDMNLNSKFRHLQKKIDTFKPDLMGMSLLTLEYIKFYNYHYIIYQKLFYNF